MVMGGDVPDAAYWVEVGGDGRAHPYGMYKLVNQREIEVTNSITTTEKNPRRWVILRDGEYEVWVLQRYEAEYGYQLQPDERVSPAERDAIDLKQRALQNPSTVTLDELQSYTERDDPSVLKHVLIAAYYVAKAHPEIPGENVTQLREQLREQTGHVDLDHVPTVKSILQAHENASNNGEP